MTLAHLAGTKRAILLRLKASGPASIEELARVLKITREAARLQVRQLQEEGWLGASRAKDGKRRGRPVARYALTVAAESLFPKAYDELAIGVIDAVAEKFGPQGMNEVLSAMADARVEELEGLVRGKPIKERLELLTGIYRKDDPYMSVDCSEGLSLVESNCPYLNVASRRPQLCSLTVSVLSRLLGRQVVRKERFQDGQGRCVFRILDEPVKPGARFKAEPDDRPAA